MKHLSFLPIALFALTACQATVRTSQPATSVSAPVAPAADERRARTNACLIKIGKEPLPEKLLGMNAPMNKEEVTAFRACMAASA